MNTDPRGYQQEASHKPFSSLKLVRLLSVSICVHLWLFTFSVQAQPNQTIDPGYLWWEAEQPLATNVPDRSPFDPSTGGDFRVLSNRDWLSAVLPADQQDQPFAAAYRLNIPEAGPYTLWARKFWKHGPFEWRFAQQPWQTVPRDVHLLDNAPIRQHLGVNWVAAGSANLDAGPTIFAWKMTDLQPNKDEAIGFDAFLLLRDDGPHAAFLPQGNTKPDQPPALDPTPGHFPWTLDQQPPPKDPNQIGFDLRSLNETVAGQHGRVTRSPDGNDFHLANGQPVRFWGVNVKPSFGSAPQPALDAWARQLARFGVNLVRVHGPLWTEQKNRWAIDPRKLDNLHRIVHACKQQGIYVKISWYFPVWVNAPHAGLPGYQNANLKTPFAAVFISPEFQDWYFQSLREILTPTNPHTGLSLAQDPAVALVELVNEDSLFFWTFKQDNLPPALWQQLEADYQNSPHHRGGPLRDIWHLTREGLEQANDTVADQARAQAAFLAETQRDFYARAVQQLRDLDYQGLTLASNWHTADAPLLDALERWTYTATDVTDHHGYFQGEHRGSASAWAVRVGDRFQSRTALDDLEGTPLRVNQALGHPSMISEIGWPHPNAHQAEMTTLVAVALGHQGVDAVTFFLNTSPLLHHPDLTQKFSLDAPTMLGSFPAAALAFRNGLIPQQPQALLEPLASHALKNLAGSKSASAAALDALRAADVPPNQRGQDWQTTQRVDHLAAFLGPVTRAYDQPDTPEQQRRVAPFLTDQRQRFQLQHEQTQLDYQRGQSFLWQQTPDDPDAAQPQLLVTKNPPPPQAHLQHTDAPYLTYAAVPLDDTGQRFLLQLLTTAKPRAFSTTQTHDGPLQITQLGSRPWLLQQHQTTVQHPFPNNENLTLTALDHHGNKTNQQPTPNPDRTFRWPANTLYVLAERQPENHQKPDP